jgi:hypothetical protein
MTSVLMGLLQLLLAQRLWPWALAAAPALLLLWVVMVHIHFVTRTSCVVGCIPTRTTTVSGPVGCCGWQHSMLFSQARLTRAWAKRLQGCPRLSKAGVCLPARPQYLQLGDVHRLAPSDTVLHVCIATCYGGTVSAA